MYGKYRRANRRNLRLRRRGTRLRRRLVRKPVNKGQVKRIIGAELKKSELAFGAATIPSISGVVVNVSNINLGESFNERNGNWVKPVMLQGYVAFRGNPVQFGDQASVTARVAIIRWNNDIEFEPPSIVRIMSDTSNPMCPFNLRSKGSFKVLWTRVCLLSNNDDNTTSTLLYRFRIRLSGAPKMTWDENTQKKFSYFLIAYSEVPTEEAPPTLEFCSNLRYTDS